jgi:ABC-type lipoprotein release transport system permease subunit
MRFWIWFSWRNLWRNRRRTLLQLLAIAGTVFLGVFFQNVATGEYTDMIRMGVRTGSGDVGIYHKHYLQDRGQNQTVPVGPWVARVRQIPGVERVFLRLYVPALVRSPWATQGGVVLGMDLHREADHPFLQEHRRKGHLPRPGRAEALIGADLAERLGLRVGKKLVVMMQDWDGTTVSALLRVRGILHTGIPEVDARMVVVDRIWLGTLLGDTSRVHEVAVLLKPGVRPHQILRSLQPLLDPFPEVRAYPWEEAMPELRSAIRIDHTSMVIMMLFMYIVVGIGALNVMFMSVLERTHEIGLLRAVGMTARQIHRLVVLEGVQLAIVGALSGSAAAHALTLLLQKPGLDLSGLTSAQSFGGVLWEPVIHPYPDVSGMLTFAGIMILLVILGSWFPARWAAHQPPATAMRTP